MLAIRGAGMGRRTLLVDAEPWLDVQRVWLGAQQSFRFLDAMLATHVLDADTGDPETQTTRLAEALGA